LRETQMPHESKLRMVMHAVCQCGAKSFSHLLNSLERYNELARSVINNETRRVQAIAVVASFWSLSKFHLIITLDKLMTYRIVDNIAIVNWLFSPDQLPDFTRGYVWEILHNTINKTIARTHTLQNELENARRIVRERGVTDEGAPEQAKLRHTHEVLDTALREQKELLLVVFQRFCLAISNHLTNCEARNVNPYDSWYYCAIGYLKEIGRRYHKEIEGFLSALENILFTPDVDPRITQVFHQFKNVY